MLVVGVMWRNTSGGLTSLSSLERPVFAPLIAFTASSFRLGRRLSHLSWVVVWALPLLYRF
jgi:hypothetical protein